MASGQEPAAPQSLQRGTEEVQRGEGIPQRHPNGADGARPDHGALELQKYGLLAPEEPADDPYATEPQDSRDNPKDTSETGITDKRGTETGEQNGLHAPRAGRGARIPQTAARA